MMEASKICNLLQIWMIYSLHWILSLCEVRLCEDGFLNLFLNVLFQVQIVNKVICVMLVAIYHINILIWRQMSSQSGQEGYFQDIQLFNRNQKVVEVNQESEDKAKQIARKTQFKTQCNEDLDPKNQANKWSIDFEITKGPTLDRYLMPCKAVQIKRALFGQIRDLMEQRGYEEPAYVQDKCGLSTLVVEFVYFKQKVGILDNSIFQIEDTSGRENIVVKNGIVWVGMICAIQATFENGQYRLKRIIDLSQQVQGKRIERQIGKPMRAYRMLLLKAPFKKMDGKQDIGCVLLYEQLAKLAKMKSGVDCIFIMGPFMHRKNTLVSNSQLENSNSQQFETTIQIITEKVKKYFPSAKIMLMPSTQDVFHAFSIPQIPYELEQFDFEPNVRSLSNPGSINFLSQSPFSIQFLNYDLLNYIDNHKGGVYSKDVLQENFETYFKTPFLTSNIDQPFDYSNLPFLYNAGKFADILVISSKSSPPYAKIIQKRLVVNIGSLGIEKNTSNKHFMALMSIYEGQGPVSLRTKVESIIMEGQSQ